MVDKKVRAELELVAALRAGYGAAVAQWYKEYEPRLYLFVSQRLAHPKEIEEIVQETFINALKQLAFFRGQSSLFGWMCGIARHEVADFYRKKYAKKAIKSSPLNELLPHKVNDSHEVSEQVKAAFNRLSRQHVELLMLKYIDGKRVEEIAMELGRTVKAIESDLFRARQAFKVAYTETAKVVA